MTLFLIIGKGGATAPDAARDFYCRILGFRVSDPIDFGARLPESERGKHGPRIGYFARHGGDAPDRDLDGFNATLYAAAVPAL